MNNQETTPVSIPSLLLTLGLTVLFLAGGLYMLFSEIAAPILTIAAEK